MRCRQLLPLSILFIPFVAAAADLPHSEPYPTLERVDYVLECMDRNGGENIDNLRSCACEFDVVAKTMPQEDYDSAIAYKEFKDVPADRGGEFRDSKYARTSYETLLEARKVAKKQCFLRHVVSKKKPQKGTSSD
jgi:hypothetical protein